jgi:hypothetical protein
MTESEFAALQERADAALAEHERLLQEIQIQTSLRPTTLERTLAAGLELDLGAA